MSNVTLLTVSPAAVTVRFSVIASPNVNAVPAAGAPALQFAASDRLPSASTFQLVSPADCVSSVMVTSPFAAANVATLPAGRFASDRFETSGAEPV